MRAQVLRYRERPFCQLRPLSIFLTLDDLSQSVWPVKSCQMSAKGAQNYFTRKMKDFDTYSKITLNMSNLGKKIVATGFKK